MKIKKKGLSSAILALKKHAVTVEQANEITDKLANMGAAAVKMQHEGTVDTNYRLTESGVVATPMYSDATVRVEKTKNGHVIVAEGDQLLFFEFGAGVDKNSPREWSNKLDVPVPPNISDIGTYGYGMGSNSQWFYKDEETGDSYMTSGYKARAGFALAITLIVARANEIIKEVRGKK